MVNENRFPVAALAETATLNEPQSIEQMIKPIYKHIGIIVGDAAYKVYEVIRNILNQYKVLIQVRTQIKDKTMNWYKRLIDTPQALCLVCIPHCTFRQIRRRHR